MASTGWQVSRPRLAGFLLVSGVALAGGVLAYFRIPATSARTVWAEDGELFLSEYLEQGPVLLAPYAGYLHFLPRSIVAIVTPVFGLEAYAAAITVSCCVVLGLVAALTFYCASALTTNLAARLCWASIPVLAAPSALETMGNLANLHWYMLWLAPWVLLKSPATAGQGILLGASALVIGLTEIQSAFFLPLLFFRLGERSLWWAKAGLSAGVACQLVSMWMFPRFQGGTGEDSDLLSIVFGYFLNSSAAILYGSSAAIIDHIQVFGAAPIVLSAVPFAIIAFLLARRGGPLQRLAGGIWLLASVAVWTAAVAINPAPWFHYSRFSSPEDWADFFLSRYSTAPSMFLLALLPLLIAPVTGKARVTGRLAAVVRTPQFRAVVAGAFLVLQTVYYFPVENGHARWPEWAPQIRAAQQACREDLVLGHVEILQAPGAWVTTIRCDDLRP